MQVNEGARELPFSLLRDGSKRIDRRIPIWRLMLQTCCMAGVQVAYAAQVNLGTPQLLLLGLSNRLVSFAWLAGPLAGLIVQPLVGRWSDAVGKRRPFLLIGSILTSISMITFSNAQEIAGKKLGLSLAIVCFFALDFAVQAVQAPLRMLVTDIVPAEQLPTANALLGVFTGIGLLLGGLLTGLELERYVPIFNTHAQALFGFAATILLSTTLLSVISTKEKTMTSTPILQEEEPLLDGVTTNRNRWERLRNAPKPYWAVFLVQLCTWVGFFTVFVYATSWVGRDVFGGNGEAPAESPARLTYEAGVRAAGRANAIQATITVLFSLIIPRLWRIFGVRAVYVFGQLVQAGVLLSAPWITTQYEATVILALYGIVWAVTMTVPWSLIGDALRSDSWYEQNVGLFQTIFNASQSGPQLIVALILAPVVLLVSNDDPAWVLFAGGISAILGAILVLALDVREVDTNSNDNTSSVWWQSNTNHRNEDG